MTHRCMYVHIICRYLNKKIWSRTHDQDHTFQILLREKYIAPLRSFWTVLNLNLKTLRRDWIPSIGLMIYFMIIFELRFIFRWTMVPFVQVYQLPKLPHLGDRESTYFCWNYSTSYQSLNPNLKAVYDN